MKTSTATSPPRAVPPIPLSSSTTSTMAAVPPRFPNRKFKKGTESFPQEVVEMEMAMEAEEEVETDEEWIESEEVEMDPAQREKILAAEKAAYDAAIPEKMNIVANACASTRARSLRPSAPPLQMLDYPDLFEKAWGWDMLLPMRYNDPWSKYKEYLLAYYDHNIKKANADGDADDGWNDLKSQARSCIEMEGHLLFLWNKYARFFPNAADQEIKQMSCEVKKHALEMVDALDTQFPAAAAASLKIMSLSLPSRKPGQVLCLEICSLMVFFYPSLFDFKCITKEAELMCGLIVLEDASQISHIRTSNAIRNCALRFMSYEKLDPKYVFAMATMMGIMEEAKVVYEFLWTHEIKRGNLPMSLLSRKGTLGVMLDISGECSVVDDSAGGSTAGEHVSSESDVNNFSDKLGDTSNDVNFSMTGMAEHGSLVKMNGTRITKESRIHPMTLTSL